MVRLLYSTWSTAIRCSAGSTPQIPVDRGVIQGDGLSPLLFSIAIEPVLRLLESDCILAERPAHTGFKGYKPGCITAYQGAVQETPRHHAP